MAKQRKSLGDNINEHTIHAPLNHVLIHTVITSHFLQGAKTYCLVQNSVIGSSNPFEVQLVVCQGPNSYQSDPRMTNLKNSNLRIGEHCALILFLFLSR